MNKQTQMYVGIGVVAVGAYLLYNNWKKKQSASAVVPASEKATFVKDAPMKKMAEMVGMDAKMKFSAGNEIVKDSRFAWADGGQSIAPTFFDVQDSPNSFRNR